MYPQEILYLLSVWNILMLASGTHHHFYSPQHSNFLPHPLPKPFWASASDTHLSQRRLTINPGQLSSTESPLRGGQGQSSPGQGQPSPGIGSSYDFRHYLTPSSGGPTDTNTLLLDFLYDYYEYPPYGHQGQVIPSIPPDYGWIWPPSPPPTMTPEPPPTTEPPVIPEPAYKPFKPHHHHPKPKPQDKDKDTTDEDSTSATDEDDDDKKPEPPQSLFQFGFWRPPSILPSEEYTTKFARLKAKWNRLLDRLKIQEGSSSRPSPPEVEIVNRRPIKGSGSGYPISASSTNTKFQLEQLPGWNTPPLRNPGGYNPGQRYPIITARPTRQPGLSSGGTNDGNYYGWAQLPVKSPGIHEWSYPYYPYNKYYSKK